MNSFKTWLNYERKDILEHNQSRMTACCGKKGRGKSYSTIAYGLALLPDHFDVTKHIAYFDAYDFLRIVKSSHKGDFIIFDDAGVGMDSRDWQKTTAKIMTKIGQIFRTKNLYITFTTPDFSFVDVKYRKMFDYFVTMKPIDFKRQQTVAKWYALETDEFTGEFFRKKISISGEGGHDEFIETVRANRIPDDIAQLYEEHRQKASDNLFRRAEEYAIGIGGKTLTVEQAAAALGVDSKTAWKGVLQGSIPITREGTNVKVPMKWIKEILERPDEMELAELVEKTS